MISFFFPEGRLRRGVFFFPRGISQAASPTWDVMLAVRGRVFHLYALSPFHPRLGGEDFRAFPPFGSANGKSRGGCMMHLSPPSSDLTVFSLILSSGLSPLSRKQNFGGAGRPFSFSLTGPRKEIISIVPQGLPFSPFSGSFWACSLAQLPPIFFVTLVQAHCKPAESLWGSLSG